MPRRVLTALLHALLPFALPSAETSRSEPLIALPVVDLSSPDAASKLHRAAVSVGFFAVTGHGAEAAAAAAADEALGWFRRRGGRPDPPATKPSPGYGPGLQYVGHLAAESYSTTEGTYSVPTDACSPARDDGAGDGADVDDGDGAAARTSIVADRTALREDFVVVHPDAAAAKRAGDGTTPATPRASGTATRRTGGRATRRRSAPRSRRTTARARSSRAGCSRCAPARSSARRAAPASATPRARPPRPRRRPARRRRISTPRSSGSSTSTRRTSSSATTARGPRRRASCA